MARIRSGIPPLSDPSEVFLCALASPDGPQKLDLAGDDPLGVRPFNTLIPIQELVESYAVVELLKQLGYRQQSTGKHPPTAETARV